MEWLQKAIDDSYEKVKQSSKRIGAWFPHASVNGKYDQNEPGWWTAGFWPGTLWQLYRLKDDQTFKDIATEIEEKLDEVMFDYYRLDHDIGFMWTLTAVAHYKLRGNEDAKRRALLAANLLVGRFNANGNYIRAWNPWSPGEDNRGLAIIDCMMNLPILFWASEETGDPRFRSIATLHANTVLEHFIRADGSVQHIVDFDPETGEVVGKLGGQGFAPNSAWSRGTAWALYGFSLCYQYTKDEKYLHAAQRVAHFFIAHLPKDHVPVWDFRIPQEVKKYRDTSAGAIAACGLLVLGKLTNDESASVYHGAGVNILQSLYENYGSWDQDEEGLILEGTSHYPEQKFLKNPLIYGDYYFVEGLSILHGEGLFW